MTEDARPNPPRSTVVKSSWLSSLLVGCSIVAAMLILSALVRHVVSIRYQERTISVSGSATERCRSDLVVWTARVHARAETLAEAYRVLQKGTPRVRQYLVDHEIPAEEISVGSVSSEELHARNEKGYVIREKIIGYDLYQNVQVTSKNVDLITNVSQEITQLIESGVDVRSERPEYIYTGLGELKVQLIAAATRDARNRAIQVAENSGSEVGVLTTARVGVIQVNAANESDVTWDGVNNRTSIDKDAMVVVRTTFLLE